MHLKHIPMDGPQNSRDLGGFLTASGQAVAWNRLYRAGWLEAAGVPAGLQADFCSRMLEPIR